MVDGFPSELHCCLCPFGSNWMDLGSGSASQLSLWTLFSWVISIFFLDTVQPFPKKQVMGFFIPPSHIRKADLKTYTPVRVVESSCRQSARVCVLALPFTAYMTILPIFPLIMCTICSTWRSGKGLKGIKNSMGLISISPIYIYIYFSKIDLIVKAPHFSEVCLFFFLKHLF